MHTCFFRTAREGKREMPGDRPKPNTKNEMNRQEEMAPPVKDDLNTWRVFLFTKQKKIKT